MKKSRLLGAVYATACSFLTLTSQAALVERLGGLAYYDTEADLTWLADANAAIGSVNDTWHPGTGLMTWYAANAWAQNLTVGGVGGWRLPTTLQPDATCDYQATPSGFPTQGFGYNCTGSEMGNLFYVVGVTAALPGLFDSVQSGWYWSSTESAHVTRWAHAFSFSNGYQDLQYNYLTLDAWAVHDGDVGALDPDNDGVPNAQDNCPSVPNPGQLNSDQDSLGNACDEDDDNDGTLDTFDAFPLDPTENTDTDSDGVGNNADTDDDNDGYSDILEVSVGTDPLDDQSTFLDVAGDINNDGLVNTGDLVLGIRILNGSYTPSVLEQARFDIAPLSGGLPVPDGNNTAGDYLILQNLVSGSISF